MDLTRLGVPWRFRMHSMTAINRPLAKTLNLESRPLLILWLRHVRARRPAASYTSPVYN